VIDVEQGRLTEAERRLQHALWVMATGSRRLQGEEWLLLATIIAEAGLVAQKQQRQDPTFRMPLLEQAVEELRDMTRGFTDRAFLQSTRSARRRNPALFSAAA